MTDGIIHWTQQHSGDDPYKSFRYTVQIDNTTIGGFTRVSDIGLGTDIVEYREGGLNTRTHKFPKHLHTSNVKLHRGFTHYDEFINWILEAMDAPTEAAQYDIEITLHGDTGESVWGWELNGALPVRWEGPELHSGGGVALELVELSSEKLSVVRYDKQ